jgi:hypothetical protein
MVQVHEGMRVVTGYCMPLISPPPLSPPRYEKAMPNSADAAQFLHAKGSLPAPRLFTARISQQIYCWNIIEWLTKTIFLKRSIDISWLDWGYKSSTCDVMCIVDSAATYIMVVKFRNTSWPPPPQLSLHIGELRCQAIQIEHGPYITERTPKAVYIVKCLWRGEKKSWQYAKETAERRRTLLYSVNV